MEKEKLREAEKIAIALFEAVETQELIKTGKSEKELNDEVFELAQEKFGITKHWHKRIVRSGKNTLFPYRENPPNLIIQADDILFFDFGPILDQWEADLGRTYVLGNDPLKIKLKNDVESIWMEVHQWFHNQTEPTGKELFDHVLNLSAAYGWEFGGEIAGHIIGEFPHEKLDPKDVSLYVHPENPQSMLAPDNNGNKREWILEVHLVDRNKEIGGFFEQLLT